MLLQDGKISHDWISQSNASVTLVSCHVAGQRRFDHWVTASSVVRTRSDRRRIRMTASLLSLARTSSKIEPIRSMCQWNRSVCIISSAFLSLSLSVSTMNSNATHWRWIVWYEKEDDAGSRSHCNIYFVEMPSNQVEWELGYESRRCISLMKMMFLNNSFVIPRFVSWCSVRLLGRKLEWDKWIRYLSQKGNEGHYFTGIGWLSKFRRRFLIQHNDRHTTAFDWTLTVYLVDIGLNIVCVWSLDSLLTLVPILYSNLIASGVSDARWGK